MPKPIVQVADKSDTDLPLMKDPSIHLTALDPPPCNIDVFGSIAASASPSIPHTKMEDNINATSIAPLIDNHPGVGGDSSTRPPI